MSNRLIQNIFAAFKSHLDTSPQPLKNRKAIHAITHCRTREMGLSYFTCSDNHVGIEQYHSCRNRSCFLCAQKKRLEWVEAQKKRLFNTPHFHVVFTLPHEYLSLWRYNEALFSQLLFKASQNTLRELLGDEKYGGITPGILMALHTWGRQLTLHPHTHCLVSAGGLNNQGEWKALGEYLVPGGVIRSVYRGKLQALLRDSVKSGNLKWPPDMSLGQFWGTYSSLYKKPWCVRIEDRYDHGKGVLLYLARYCKGGPINPKQIRSIDKKQIELSYLDHRDKRVKRLQLKPNEFLRRLLEHVPALGIHTVRYYGLYASAAKKKHALCLEVLGSLSGFKVASSDSLITMLLYCKTCGKPSTLSCQTWPSKKGKGNSIYRVYRFDLADGFIQQADECRPGSALRGGDP